jgi:hypothetical protein
VKVIAKYWGYAALLVVIYGWISQSIGPAVLVSLSSLSFLYTIFQAPVWCCVETRTGQYCRNNASGLLMGCHIREHKWRKLKLMVSRHSWGSLGLKLIAGFGAKAASFSALAGLTSATAAVITLAIKH